MNLDKYYTKKHIADNLINMFKENIDINKEDLIIESSAGNGSFIEGIKKLSNNYLFYDIAPENDEITEQDYLRLDVSEFLGKKRQIHIIGNPPFGRQSSLVIKFIKKSCEFCDSFGFILPKSFKKDSLKSKIPLKFHLIFQLDLESKSFIFKEKDYDVPCIFQIWKKMDYDRNKPEILRPLNYIFVKKDESPDISIRRVGVNAGIITYDLDEINKKNIQTHYFIRFVNEKKINMDKLINNKFIYEFNNSVGAKSLSKQEIIYKFRSINIL